MQSSDPLKKPTPGIARESGLWGSRESVPKRARSRYDGRERAFEGNARVNQDSQKEPALAMTDENGLSRGMLV